MQILIALCILVVSLEAVGAPEPYIPPELEPWRAWVLEGHKATRCAYTKPLGYLCRWPGVLKLDLDPHGAQFEQRWRLTIAGWVPLPGQGDVWPVSVQVDGKPVPVSEESARPAVYLSAGEYVVSGRFDWINPPEGLAIPSDAGILSLTHKGQPVNHPNLRGEYLWLATEQDQLARTEDSLNLSVSRLLADGIPQTLTTSIMLSVTGAGREARLGLAIPEGFTLTGVTSQLAVRITDAGILYAQLRPGEWNVQVKVRATQKFGQIGPPKALVPWPEQEVWSYRADTNLRVTSVRGTTPVDPRQTQMPTAWREFPAYVLSPGETLSIMEHSRGADMSRDNPLVLNRAIWLRFNGETFVIEDWLSGQMAVDWRLNMLAPYRLTRLEEAGQPQLLTRLEKGAPTGAEVRLAQTSIHAVSTLEAGAGAIPASGWSQNLKSVTATLHLPPGYRLLAVTGYDQSRGDWLSKWGLISIFGVVIVAVCAARVLGWGWGILSLGALILTVHTPNSPLWLWLNALLALGLMGTLSRGRLHRAVGIYVVFSLLALLVVYVPFALHQARLAFYPQLALHAQSPPELKVSQIQAEPKAPQDLLTRDKRASISSFALAEKARSIITGTDADKRPGTPERYADFPGDALIQAGIAAPEWRWQSVSLALNGPVRMQQTVSYWIMPPWLTSLWRLAGVILAGLFLARLFWRLHRQWSGKSPQPGAATAMIFLLLLLPGAALAQTPDASILKELEQRLIRPPICGAQCAQIQAATVTVTNDRLSLQLEVHAHTQTAIRVPGSRIGWLPDQVHTDGQDKSWLLRKDHALWAPLPDKGHYTLHLSGPTPASNSFNLQFPARPKHISLEAEGWQVSGIRDGKLTSNDLRFVRLARPEQAKKEQFTRINVPPFVIVQREFILGVKWYIHTRVVRNAPEHGAFTLTLPLLPRERVLSDQDSIQVQDNQIKVSFAAQDRFIHFKSRLPEHSPIVLAAADAEHFRQHFSFDVDHLWHLEATGLPPAATVKPGTQRFFPIYYPRPGEQLKLLITRPEAVPGETLAIDSVQQETRVGLRGRETSLRFTYRATRGGSHTLTLPAGVAMEQLTLDSQDTGVVPVDQDVTFAVQPGIHRVTLIWQRLTDNLLALSTPQPNLNADTANMELELRLPRDRWVLWASGPHLGPAVMYWSELALIFVIALILGSFKRLPLSRVQWVLLAVGLSLTAWPAILMLFAWLLALDWRGRKDSKWHWQAFNLTQMGLALASVIVIASLLFTIFLGLWSNPDMGIIGQRSTPDKLNWFADFSTGLLPTGTVISLPMWCYKALILLWSIWLSLALIGWLKWAWGRFSKGGLWKSWPSPEKKVSASAGK